MVQTETAFYNNITMYLLVELLAYSIQHPAWVQRKTRHWKSENSTKL